MSKTAFGRELVQLPLNVLDRRPIVSGTLARLKAAGVEIHARSVFLQGLLLMEPNDLPEFFAPVRDKIASLRGLWRKQGLSALDGCLAFALRRPEIDAIIVGVNRQTEFEQIEAAVASVRGADVDWTPIKSIDPVYVDPSQWPVVRPLKEKPVMPNIARSQELLDRARRVIPSATQTFSKGPNQWVRGVSPHYLVRGEGAWVWDADGNKYLDYLMALGPIILGYGNRAGERSRDAPGRGWHRVQPDASAGSRSRRDARRSHSLRRDGAFRKKRFGRDDRCSACRARLHRSRSRGVLRLSRLARLVHRHDNAQ